jgi:undecaprenyl-diphosphatase
VSEIDLTPEIADAAEHPALGDRLHAAVAPFDEAVDQLFDRLRGHRGLDRAFYAASELADFSLLWQILTTAKALRADDPLPTAVRTSTLLGIESVTVNWGVKSLFGRSRPVHDEERPHHLRTPLTSSFPSGHASAAFTAAALLSEDSRLAPVYYALAVFVSASRVHVRIHHASDVVAGAALGIVLGATMRRVWPSGRRRRRREG